MTTPEEVEEAVRRLEADIADAINDLGVYEYARKDQNYGANLAMSRAILSKLSPFLKAAMRLGECVDIVGGVELATMNSFMAEYRALMAPPEVK